MVDGERMEGTWRHAFVRNGDYYLTDLLIYADGKVDCWGLVDFSEFCSKVRSGWVATEFPQGARASAHHVASWVMDQPQSWVSAEELIGEVADEIAWLRGEPTSSDRCQAAVDAYLADQTPEALERVRDAYQAVPEHLRIYLGDMDAKDRPILQILTPVGQPLPGDTGDDWAVTEEDRQAALDWLIQDARERTPRERARWTDPERPPGQRDVVAFKEAYKVSIDPVTGKRTSTLDPETAWLSPASLHPVTDAGLTWPTALHAYLAAAVAEPAVADAIRDCERPGEAVALFRDAPKKDNWAQARLAVMARLLRLKFAQHPDLAVRLLATGDAILQSSSTTGSTYWDSHGQNWTGRLLELIRAELAV